MHRSRHLHRHQGANSLSRGRNGSKISTEKQSKVRAITKPWRLLPSIRNLLLLVILVVAIFTILRLQPDHKFTDDLPYTKKRPPVQVFYPLMIQSNNATHHNDIMRVELQEEPPLAIQYRRNRYWLNHFKEDTDADDENAPKIWPKEGCQALGEWQTQQAHSNCNTIHEVSMTEFFNTRGDAIFRYIADGGFRIAWMFTDWDGMESPRVLKTLKYSKKRHFDLDNFERHRRDAIAAEQLTFSPFIANIYGHCAVSSLVDYSDKKSLYYLFDDKGDNTTTLPSLDVVFQIAYDIVASVADTHHFNQDGRATIAHMDIKPNQWIYLNGRYKLNDYNICKFLSWNVTSNEHCGHTSGYKTGRWQAPEQYRRKAPLSEKADVYSLGNILYYLLTNGTKPFNELDADKAFRYLAKGGGRVAFENTTIANSTHPFHVHVGHAMRMCHEHDPFQRPNARQVLNYLGPKLNEYFGKEIHKAT